MAGRERIAAGWWVGLGCALVGLLGGCATGELAVSSSQAPTAQSDARLTADCPGGVAKGCYGLAVRYAEGRGVDKDERRAAELLEKACGGGSAKGCGVLGELYEEGRGVDKDKHRAVALYDKACEGGFTTACGWR